MPQRGPLKLEEFQQQYKQFFLDSIAAFKAPAPKNLKSAKEHHSSEDIRIGARVRPLLEGEEENGAIASVVAHSDAGSIDVHELRQKSGSFHLDKVYGPAEDSEVLYQDLFKPLVKWAWDGGVSTLFAYGQTGSGKTYSVNDMERLAATELMSGVLGGKRDVYICVFELIGNASYDLLNDHRSISVLEDSFGETQLVGAVEQQPTSAEELLALIEKSMAFRKTAPTVKNDTSSRSHAICRIRIVNKEFPDLPDGVLYVVDLAGSEMAGDIKDHSNDRMKETRDINVSLSILKDCIRGRALVDGMGSKKNKAHIPFRSSVLTKVLKNVFDVKSERTSKTAVLACVKPNLRDISATKNTLRYAELLRVDVPTPKLAIFDGNSPRTWNNEKLREWIEKNSGSPSISSSDLAPIETGMQLLRLPKAEFISRCQKTPGITAEHARTFYDKLWKIHIDSRATASRNTDGESQATSGTATPAIPTTPFKERLRPGMFVRLDWSHLGEEHNIAMIMCPEFAFENPPAGQEKKEKSYLCARISPAILHDAYNLNIEPLLTVPLSRMASEVFMEFDSATRYYYHMLP
ncbi:hypothetical protein BP5796_04020 [Coleophoma crateriformis]|uniref:Kinesin-like protein n=1 Tax=Coleophoma crateriformis TaxID=565419 RepID=A0A3D8SH66_9HELO|nr:hypothetical protein BP5796_04020 [Coleophoma crateriformis]